MNENKTLIFSLCDINNLNEVSSVKFLGVELDSLLTWEYHIDELSKKLAKNIFLIRNLSKCVSNKILTTAYFGIFHANMQFLIGDIHLTVQKYSGFNVNVSEY